VVRCLAAGPFSVIEQGRLPATVTSRAVDTAAGPKPISLADGYRVILATAQGLPFLNLKVELSSPTAAAADREAVQAQMAAFAARRSAAQPGLQHSSASGVEVLSLHQPNLDRGGPVSFYSFLQPASGVIATLYVLNQPPAQRAFASYADYEALRDKAAQWVQGCLGGGA
jgi:hypothetical protein